MANIKRLIKNLDATVNRCRLMNLPIHFECNTWVQGDLLKMIVRPVGYSNDWEIETLHMDNGVAKPIYSDELYNTETFIRLHLHRGIGTALRSTLRKGWKIVGRVPANDLWMMSHDMLTIGWQHNDVCRYTKGKLDFNSGVVDELKQLDIVDISTMSNCTLW